MAALNYPSLLSSNQLRAFLRVIREGESNQQDDGPESAYRAMYHPTERRFWLGPLEGPHPRAYEPLPDGSGRRSSAFGAYQFTATTWDLVREKVGLPDSIKPYNQDCMAVALIWLESALDDVIDGRFDEALRKCGSQWASLPGSSLEDGGSKVAYARAKAVWEKYGGGVPVVISRATDDRTDAPAPVDDLSTPARPEDVDRINAADLPQRETPMAAPLLIPLISMIGQLIPSIAALFGKDGEKVAAKAAAAQQAIDIVTKSVGAMNAQDAVEKIAADPAKVAVAQAALYSDPMIGGMLTEVGGGIAAAHARAIDPAQPPLYRNPAFWISLMLLPLAYYVVVAVIGVPWGGKFLAAEVTQDVRSMVIGGVMGTVLGGIVAFWLGTSYGSARKTDIIANR